MFRIYPKILTILAGASMALMAVGQYAIWFYAPEETTMGVVQKIFYFHLPWRGGPLSLFSESAPPARWCCGPAGSTGTCWPECWPR